ncbi:exodeoxyribonuclease V subunit alpha [Arsenophonus endosymbiont of Lipoptena cervi]|uniref:exodeoxyribonuclease V subunit alpha n=1 Tax=Arsenophonus endosymbiont of Lipoptena cervi TaxID=363258 RepID=UPI00376EA2C8
MIYLVPLIEVINVMISLLKKAINLNLFHSLDVQLAIRLVKDENPLLLLIFSLLSAATRIGHVCLFIDKLQPDYLFFGNHIEISLALWEKSGSPNVDKIYYELKKCNAVYDLHNASIKPLVLSGNKLYFQRMWFDEGLVANFFSNNLIKIIDEERLKITLTRFFEPSNIINWQKIAVALAVTSRIAIISGGPGTGKTTTVARLLATLVALSDKKLIIKLVAPTGKAATRLTKSLNSTLLKLNLSNTEKEIIPYKAQTIHRLLGAQIDNESLRYNEENLLSLDVLIIDEASMISLSIMAKLIKALPDNSHIILLGDSDQLASVEAGAVFHDLCSFSKYGYSYERVKQLSKITNYDLSNFISNNGPEIKDRICLLHTSYRFDTKSQIGLFATAVKQCNMNYINKLLTKSANGAEVTFNHLGSSDQYAQLLFDIVKNYSYYFNMIYINYDPEEILTAFNSYRLLVALREGPYGVMGLNYQLEYVLYHNGIIKYKDHSWYKNYEGRPIMILENDSSLNLFNGDIGIILRDGQRDLKAFFQLPNGITKKISLSRLPKHETTFAMTVHKSQGSEFEHVALVLPPIFSSIISKELIYTAITRAKNQLTIYSDINVLIKGLCTSTERFSGLTERLFY